MHPKTWEKNESNEISHPARSSTMQGSSSCMKPCPKLVLHVRTEYLCFNWTNSPSELCSPCHSMLTSLDPDGTKANDYFKFPNQSSQINTPKCQHPFPISSKLENFLNFYLFNRRIITLQHCDGFLPYINMNWLQVYMGPLHPEIPFHFPPHPIPPGCHRALALDASSIKLALVIYFMCGDNSLSLSIWESTLCFVCSYTWEVGRAEVTGISMKLPKDFDVY